MRPMGMGYKLQPLSVVLRRRRRSFSFRWPLPSVRCFSAAGLAAAALPPRGRASDTNRNRREATGCRNSFPGPCTPSFDEEKLSREHGSASSRTGLARNKNQRTEMTTADRRREEEALNSTICSLCREGRVPEALQAFKEGCVNHRRPSIAAHNDLFGALVANGLDLESVVFVYKEMVKGGTSPDVETLNCLIEALFRASRVDSAVDQFRRMNMKRCAPNSRTFELMMCYLCINGRVDESVKVLEELFECGCKPDDRLFSSVIPLLCTLSRCFEAMRLFQLMRVVGVSADSSVYCVLISCLCENEELDQAVDLLEEMSGKALAPDANVYVSIASGFCKLGRLDEVRNLLNKNGVVQVEPYHALLDGYCRTGRFLDASVLLREMFENGVSDKISWNIFIRYLSESKNPKRAFEVLSKMVVLGYLPDEVTFSAVISGHCHAGAYESALNCFQHLSVKSWYLAAECASHLVHGLCLARKIKEATDILCYISRKSHNIPTSSLNLLISMLCTDGFVNEAIKLRSFSFCRGIPSCSVTFNTIIRTLLRLNKAEHVRTLLSQMLLEGCTPDVETYYLMVHGFCTINMTVDAVLLVNQMVFIDFIPCSKSVDALLSCLAKYCQMHNVALSLEKLIDRGLLLSSTAFNVIVSALVREGHKHEACRFLDRMLEKGWIPDTVTHGLLVGKASEGENKSYIQPILSADDNVTLLLADGLSNANDCTIT